MTVYEELFLRRYPTWKKKKKKQKYQKFYLNITSSFRYNISQSIPYIYNIIKYMLFPYLNNITSKKYDICSSLLQLSTEKQWKKNFTYINSFMVPLRPKFLRDYKALQAIGIGIYLYIYIHVLCRSLGHTAWSVPRLGTSSMTKRSGCFGSGLDKQIERSTDGRSFNRGTFKLEAWNL